MIWQRRKIAVIGAGPVGLEAALAALESGYEINLYERGEIAEAIKQWGHVRMFSPFGMNTSQRGLARLHVAGVRLPRPDVLQTGAQFREAYLLPLARLLASRIQVNCEVMAIGRSRRLKGDFVSDPQRGAGAFRLLVRDSRGERSESADVVLDCSGTFAQPNSLGDGGIPAPGEAACSARIHYGIPNFFNGARDRFAGRRLLVIGTGHSAATVIANLAQLPAKMETTWLIRRERRVPSVEIPNDPLPERSHLAATANRLARDEQVQLLTGASIDALAPKPEGIEVHWSDAHGTKSSLFVDEIIAATGYRPDLALTRELQTQTCWATEGTYPLAASLLGETGVDCLAAPAGSAEMLLHPEPGYFTLGMKSYGRTPNFLLRTGYEQVHATFDWLARKSEPTPK